MFVVGYKVSSIIMLYFTLYILYFYCRILRYIGTFVRLDTTQTMCKCDRNTLPKTLHLVIYSRLAS